jgi:uncharacterized protein YaiI (UPF0178 family)
MNPSLLAPGYAGARPAAKPASPGTDGSVLPWRPPSPYVDRGKERKQSVTAIYVDGDACPVKEEVLRVAGRHEIVTHLVSNRWLRGQDSPLINRIVVGDGFDAADNWIAEHAARNDIVVTADIQLADRCIKAGADVIGPNGKPFTEANIGMALAMRELNAQLRDLGEIRGMNAAFSKQDRSNFLQGLERLIQEIRRRRS